MIRDAIFTCNTRQLFDAYSGKAYMMQYSFPAPNKSPALHASDLVPTFINSDTHVIEWLHSQGLPWLNASAAATVLVGFRPPYQKYFASYAAFGDPNKSPDPNHINWPLASLDAAGDVTGVLEAHYAPGRHFLHPFFGTITDQQNTADSCDFWTKIANEIEAITSEDKDNSMIGSTEDGTLFPANEQIVLADTNELR